MGFSKTEIIFILMIYYTVLSITMSFIGGTIANIESPNITTYDNIIQPFSNVITGFSALPSWINTLLFTPLIITLTWIVVSSLPTINGGS